MPAGPKATLHVWDGYIMFTAPGAVTSFHAHYAASIVIGDGKEFSVEDKDGRTDRFSAVFIPPNFYHKLSAAGANLLVFQVDPDLDEFQPLGGLSFSRPMPLESAVKLGDKIRQRFLSDCTCEEAMDLLHDVLRAASPGMSAARNRDSRIDTVLGYLRSLEELPEDITTAEMAQSVGLSEDRFRAVFREHMGLPFRRYLLWLRLRRAGFLLSDGITLTQAAHAAGFYDSAHFSRTFREMFGQAPSTLFDPDAGVNVKFC